jgi:prepilin-type N-terminal cleavage/methylation domain-containing protein
MKLTRHRLGIRLGTGHQAGFTLVEVLVALSIVAIALMAGLQASAALTRHAQRNRIFCWRNCALKTRWLKPG